MYTIILAGTSLKLDYILVILTYLKTKTKKLGKIQVTCAISQLNTELVGYISLDFNLPIHNPYLPLNTGHEIS